MSRHPLWQISVTSHPEAEEVIAATLESLIGEPSVRYQDRDSGTVTVTVYPPKLPHGSPDSLRKELQQKLDPFSEEGIPTARAEIRIEKLPPTDWAESWKAHFQPISIGNDLVIQPTWITPTPDSSRAAVIHLDPGMSFGTGQHPTTRFCLEQIAAFCKTHPRPALLDMGCGSGILAIAGAKLHCEPIDAFDYDPDAVRTAAANARQNGVLNRIRFATSDVTELADLPQSRFDLVCANLFAPILLKAAGKITARVAPAGRLILAGILETQFAEIEAHYRAAGWYPTATHAEDEWKSGAFARATDLSSLA